MARHIELERKYDAEADLALPDLREVGGCARVGPPETHILRASYFDTEDLRLAARGITLRRREGGGDEGWHLKLPAGKDTKREIRTPLDAGTHTVPAELSELVAAHVRGRPLIRVAEVETHRTERGLLGEDGTVLAELADDTVHARRLSRDGHEVALMRWRELEVEAVEGSREVVESIGGRLRESGARESAAASKLARALEDDITPVRRPTATRTAGDVLLRYLGEQVEQLLAYDPRVRLAENDDDSVHKMRVAVRRTRSVLRTHRRLLDPVRIQTLDTELRWLAGALGDVRDLEVQNARFHRRLAELPGAHQSPAWLLVMADEEHRARDQMREVLLTRRYYDLLDALDAFLADPPLRARAARPAAKETPRLVARAWRKMMRRYDRAARLPAGQDRDAALHGTRKAAKRARYTAEAASAALGSPAAKLARRAERLQDVLGEHHDGVVAAERLAATTGWPDTPAADTFVAGRLAEVERREAARVLEDLPAAAKKAAKRKPLRKLGKKK
ncbi:CYTH and CHAD domain-containing protein [Actinoallomurus iriomotensis]|uniref:CHAD domain-containing protein n=1 Tax=Actinoallomurus iriomotensis TaxID=478107 RepID=A0A9W6VZY8_9ACTN|nr:CYTH and CHAD domain-containing protein [Actinoallomurus iriomotensis]GLY91718.1 CHAD domain-containing protein [Actinoallomurus iriomotensis]